ncbi:MAG: hypothetical protein NC043_01470 [Muribaculaceae bacterium]|nr:hypothetical protein [Muribaculaceae bacterium]
MMKIRYIWAAISLAAASGAGAQTLEQEITVDHEVIPEHREVSRPYFTPAITLPSITQKHLAYSSRPINIAVPGSITTLEPAAFADTLYTSPYRGYAALGYFPLVNIGAAAGYKFIDNDHTRLNAFMQYNGSAYHGPYPDYERITGADDRLIRNNALTLDVTLHQAIGKRSFIDAGADLTVARYSMPDGAHFLPQNMHRADISAAFNSSTQKFVYRAGLAYSHFGYGNTILNNLTPRNVYEPARENAFKLNGFMRMDMDATSSVGIDGDFSLLSYGRRSVADFSQSESTYYLFDAGSYTHALLTLKPHYRFSVRDFRLDVGARVDFTFNSGKVFHIAPDIQATWKPGQIFAIYAKAGGGEHQNTLSSLFDATPYAQSMMAYSNSHIPLTLDAGLTIGTWKGMYLELGAGYARANDWLMPVINAYESFSITDGAYTPAYHKMTIFSPVNIKGFHWRVAAGYSYRNIASLELTYEGAPQKYDKGYYLWRDRAKSVSSAKLKVNPIAPLDVTLTYTLRTGRAMIDYHRSSDPAIRDYYVSHDLGNSRMLDLGLLYRINSQWSAFGNATNLLNSHYLLIGDVPARGITGLVGATYKF